MNGAKTMIALVSIMILAVASNVGAASCCGGGGFGPGGTALNLEQQKKADSIRLDFLKKTQKLRFDIDKKRLELMEMAKTADPDRKAIESKKDEIWALQDRIRAEARAMWKEFDALLTPEQRQGIGPTPGPVRGQ